MKEKVEELKRYAVRLKSGNNNLGSGVLWKPRLCQKHNLYIFTAAHVIKNQENILVEFERDEGTIELAINELVISDKYQKDGDPFDVAIIPIDYEYQELTSYRVAELSHDLNKILKNPQLVMLGFPEEGGIDSSFGLSMDTLKCEYEAVDRSIEAIKYKFVVPNIDNSDKNSELTGFSGAGIFAQIDSEIVLLGIHKGALGENAARGNLLGTTVDFIREMCIENNYDIPENTEIVNGDLSDRRTFFIEDIMEDLKEDDYDKEFVNEYNGMIEEKEKIQQNKSFCENKEKIAKDIFQTVRTQLEEYIKRVFGGVTISQIYSKIEPHKRFTKLQYKVSINDNGVPELYMKVLNDKNEDIMPELFFSSAQLNTVALSVFLGGALSTSNPKVNTIFIDDPIGHFDDLNVLSFIDVLRTIISETDWQIIISTHEESFYEIMKVKLNPKYYNSKFLIFKDEGNVEEDLKV